MGDLPNTGVPVYRIGSTRGICKWTRYFQWTMWEPRGFSLREIGANQLAFIPSRCSPSKGGSGLWGPSNSWNAHFRNTFRLGPTWKWSNTIIHTSGHIGVVFHYCLVFAWQEWQIILKLMWYNCVMVQIWERILLQIVDYLATLKCAHVHCTGADIRPPCLDWSLTWL